jgi:molecular chaperone DnaK
MASNNKSLGRFDLTNIPPAPRGMPQIEVTFDIDSNGIIHVSAKDKGTGKEQSIKIERSGQLDNNEIESMIKDAEIHAAEDQKQREFIESKNQLDSIVFQGEKTIEEHKDNIPKELYDKVEMSLKETK